MPSDKIITVSEATGAEGGGLVRAIAIDPNSEFPVRDLPYFTPYEKYLKQVLIK